MRWPNVAMAPAALLAASLVVFGMLYLPYHHLYLDGEAYTEVFERLPATLELIIASAFIALALAVACKLLSGPTTARTGAILCSILTAVMFVPLFLLIPITQLVFALRGLHVFSHVLQLPAGGLSQNATFTAVDRLRHLVMPATILAVVQAGAYVDSMRLGLSARVLFATFARLLPTILSADIIVEGFFAWPGVGRPFFMETEPHHTSYVVAIALLSAAAVLIVRTAALPVGRPDRIDAAIEVFEAL